MEVLYLVYSFIFRPTFDLFLASNTKKDTIHMYTPFIFRAWDFILEKMLGSGISRLHVKSSMYNFMSNSQWFSRSGVHFLFLPAVFEAPRVLDAHLDGVASVPFIPEPSGCVHKASIAFLIRISLPIDGVKRLFLSLLMCLQPLGWDVYSARLCLFHRGLFPFFLLTVEGS